MFHGSISGFAAAGCNPYYIICLKILCRLQQAMLNIKTRKYTASDDKFTSQFGNSYAALKSHEDINSFLHNPCHCCDISLQTSALTSLYKLWDPVQSCGPDHGSIDEDAKCSSCQEGPN